VEKNVVRSLLLIALGLSSGCGSVPPTTIATATKAQETRAARRPDMDEFFAMWLKAHGHQEVVVDADGVGVGGNATRLQAGLFGSKRHEKGGFVVEVEFAVRLPSRREVIEFVAGMGDTEDQAINDALTNFTLTTFHVVYKAFINDADPHVTTTTIPINGIPRVVIVGDILMRGTQSERNIDLDAIRAEIQGALKTAPLTPEPHWVKVVYSQNDGKPMTVAVTVDNAERPEMTDAVRRLDWPRQGGFYMAKQFLVIK
jgi:hypothetical protein